MAITILAPEMFKANKPNINANLRLPANEDILIIGLAIDTDHETGFQHQPWQSAESGECPVVDIEVSGKARQIPLPMLLNTVIMSEGIVHNKGNKDLKCVDFADHRLGDYLGEKFKNGDVTLPEKIVVVERIMKGWKVENIVNKDAFTEAFFKGLEKDEKGFKAVVPTNFKEYVAQAKTGWIPQLFLGDAGNSRYAFTYVIQPVKIEGIDDADPKSETETTDEKKD